jgi:hypothetical protein
LGIELADIVLVVRFEESRVALVFLMQTVDEHLTGKGRGKKGNVDKRQGARMVCMPNKSNSIHLKCLPKSDPNDGRLESVKKIDLSKCKDTLNNANPMKMEDEP